MNLEQIKKQDLEVSDLLSDIHNLIEKYKESMSPESFKTGLEAKTKFEEFWCNLELDRAEDEQ